MKTRNLFAVVAAILVSAPLFFVACNGDNSQTQDSGPQNNPDAAGKDVQQTQDTGTNDVQQTTDGGACLTFDNTLVPGYPNNIPQP
jgi:hypothetical protein